MLKIWTWKNLKNLILSKRNELFGSTHKVYYQNLRIQL